MRAGDDGGAIDAGRRSVEVQRGINSNPANERAGAKSPFTNVESGLKVQSQWSRHDFRADLRGSFLSYDEIESLNRPGAVANTALRIDVTRDTRVTLENRYTMSTDSPGSPDLQAGLAKLTIFNTYGTSLGLSQSFNHLEISGKASADRTVYQKSLLTNGTRTSNNDRNLDQYGALARVSYEIRTGVKPFVEVSAYARQHDLAVDRNGKRFSNSDPVTGQAAWYDVKVRIRKAEPGEPEHTLPQFEPMQTMPGMKAPVPRWRAWFAGRMNGKAKGGGQ